ncbi:MAG: peptidase T [Chlorobi bacterium]|nr:peptidase T [Chlorobiota bacterium]
MKTLLDRFFRYVKIDTQSDENSSTCPSTEKQLVLARMLTEEMKALGMKDVRLDKNGYVMGTLSPNDGKKLPVIGFIAHMDTSPDFLGTGVNPVIYRKYPGGDIVLNRKKKVILSPADFPELLKYKGQDIITTDGNTLLGADDKAGIAEILTAIEYLTKHPEIKHGTIRVGFTPDEEIGRGADRFDVKRFNADFAFTVDGGEIGELEFENFNAALATVEFAGRNVHPGTAKDKMINAMHLAMEFNALLPVNERPEHTEGYEGFYHLIDMEGNVEHAILRYLVRDHSKQRFMDRKRYLEQSAGLLRVKYGSDKIKVQIRDQYYNMREKIQPVMHVVKLAEQSMIARKVKPIVKPIRGGTDGARLSYMGLPTPNLFTGGHNFHGRFEFIPVQSMVKAVEVIVDLIARIAVNSKE